MKYAIIIYEAADQFASRGNANAPAYWAAYQAYSQALGPAITGGAALQGPDTGTTVRLVNGQRKVQDGPYADAKEQLGGFFVVEAPDLDAALDMAARCPAASGGVVEVRPILPMMQ